MALLVEEDVLVQQLDVQLGLGARVHALRRDLDALLQAIEDTFGVTKLRKEPDIFFNKSSTHISAASH